jgi:hypothetical protein
VAGRVLTFSDPKVIDYLQNDFIPVAINCDYFVPLDMWTRNWSESSKFMTDICRKNGKGIKPGETVQGYYPISAAGDTYGVGGACATPGQEKWMIGLLWNALEAFRKNPPAKVELKETSLPPETKIPEGTVILRVFTRMGPLSKEQDAKKDLHNQGVQRDHLWILAAEQAEILRRLADKEEADVPERLARRIILYHLIDSVRGEAPPWGLGDVKAMSFRMSRTRDSQTQIGVKLTGSFTLEHGTSYGLKGILEGVLEIDKAQKQVKSAKIYASGDAFGGGPFTPDAPEGTFPLKFAMVLVNDELSRYLAPHIINFGSPVGRVDEYVRAMGP